MKDSRFMLDTNTASYIIKGPSSALKKHLLQTPINQLCISAITEAELLHGVAKKPGAKHLPLAVKEFLLRVDILAWDSQAAEAYAYLRTNFEKHGKPLGNMDMLIAAHSVSIDAVLVTNDKAFYNIDKYLSAVDWTQEK